VNTPKNWINTNSKLLRIAVLAFPFATPSQITPVSKMVNIVSAITQKTYLIGGKYFQSLDDLPNEVNVIILKTIMHYTKGNWLNLVSIYKWFVMNLSAQMELGWQIWKHRNDVDIVLCTVGCYYQVPCLLAKILRKKIVYSSFALDPDMALVTNGRFVSIILTLLCSINFMLADKIIVDSVQTMNAPIHKPYRNKIYIGNRYVEKKFRIITPYEKREKIVGFIGRISQEKGIIDFVKALPAFLENNQDAKVIIIGSGGINELLKNELQRINLPNRIEWIGWIDHSEIPNYLNRMRLLVLPSFTEGSPNVILEAMACGTPVLATSVGGIPSLIRDRESGFILENSPHNGLFYAMNNSINYPEIQRIINNAHEIIEEEYSFSACQKRYQSIII